MTQADTSPDFKSMNLKRLGAMSFAFTFALTVALLTAPELVQARSIAEGKTTSISNSAKKKGASKVTYQRSTSEETSSERDRRMYRECKGMHNAGACRGYTR